jgi:uncharacterized membrane-anchored protein
MAIAAISYYAISLVFYLGKAGKTAGLPVNPELLAGARIPVFCGVCGEPRRKFTANWAN